MLLYFILWFFYDSCCFVLRSLKNGMFCSVWWTTWFHYVCYFLSFFLLYLFYTFTFHFHPYLFCTLFQCGIYKNNDNNPNNSWTQPTNIYFNNYSRISSSMVGWQADRNPETRVVEKASRYFFFLFFFHFVKVFVSNLFLALVVWIFSETRGVCNDYTFIPFPVVPEHFCHLPPTINSFHRQNITFAPYGTYIYAHTHTYNSQPPTRPFSCYTHTIAKNSVIFDWK